MPLRSKIIILLIAVAFVFSVVNSIRDSSSKKNKTNLQKKKKPKTNLQRVTATEVGSRSAPLKKINLHEHK